MQLHAQRDRYRYKIRETDEWMRMLSLLSLPRNLSPIRRIRHCQVKCGQKGNLICHGAGLGQITSSKSPCNMPASQPLLSGSASNLTTKVNLPKATKAQLGTWTSAGIDTGTDEQSFASAIRPAADRKFNLKIVAVIVVLLPGGTRGQQPNGCSCWQHQRHQRQPRANLSAGNFI